MGKVVSQAQQNVTDTVIVRVHADIDFEDKRLIGDDVAVVEMARNLVVLLNGADFHGILIVRPHVEILAVFDDRAIDLDQDFVEFQANLLVDEGQGVKGSRYSRSHSCGILTC